MAAPVPFSRYLLLQTTFSTVVQLVVVAVLVWLFFLPRVETDVRSRQEALAQSIVGETAAHLEAAEHQLRATAEYIDSNPHTTDSQWVALLDAQCGAGGLFETVYLADKARATVVSVGMPLARRSQRNDILGLDLTGRTFIRSAAESGLAVWSETFLSTASGRLAVAWVLPLSRYALIGEITVDHLSNFISRLPAASDLSVMILDREGRVVADSTQTLGGRYLDLGKLSGGGMAPGEGYYGEFVMDGVAFTGTALSVDALGWNVVVAQKTADAYGPIRSFLLMLAAVLGISLALALLATWLQVHRLTRLLNVYIDCTQSIARGHYDIRWPVSRTAEFATLADNLRRMAEKIHKRERQIAESENNLRITLDSIGDAVIATDAGGRIVRINPAAEKLTGWTSPEAAGKPLPEVFRIINAFTRQIAENPVERVIATGQIVGLANHTLLIARDGGEYQIADSGAPIRQPDGRIVGAVLVFRDVTESYRQQQRIRESQQLLENVTANIPGVVFMFSATPDHRYDTRFVNEKVKDLFGIDPLPDTFAADFFTGIPDGEKKQYTATIREAVDRVAEWHYEGRFTRPDGETIWFSGHAVPHREGERVVYNGVLMDITERKRMERALHLTRFSFDKAAIGIMRIGGQGEVLDANEQAARNLGYTPEELRGLTVFDIDWDFPRENWAAHRKRLRETGMAVIESFHRRKDGTLIPVEVVINLITYENEEFSISFIKDITDRKRWQEILESSERRFRDLFNRAPVMYVITDNREQEPYIRDANDLFLDVLGYDRDTILGTPLTDYYTDESKRELLDGGGYRRALDGEFMAEERSFVARDGRVVHTLLHALPDADGLGNVVGTRAMFLDITARKKAEQEARQLEAALAQAQKMEAIGTLAGGIAHDFNNILSGVIGYSELSLMQEGADPRLRSNLQHILSAGMRARDLVHQILAFSRQDEREFKPLQMGPLVKEALKLLRSSLPSTIDITRRIDGDTDNVMADPTQIHQIVMNLCTNAAHAMAEDGGEMRVSLVQTHLSGRDAGRYPGLKPGPYVKLGVRDTGKGIPREIMDKIYNPYFTTKEKGKGTGLGLSVVHGIVQSYGGAIFVTSEPGKGTTFDVFIPTVRQPSLVESQDSAEFAGGPEHILLVDDEADLIEVGRHLLQQLGYRVTTADGSLEAIAVFREAPGTFDLVLTDLTMPKMNGEKLIAELRTIRNDIPFILCTGYIHYLSEERLAKMNIPAVLKKPIMRKELAATVRRVLDETRGSGTTLS